ncbi:hypothetical protein EMCRGX_G000906 [Ephydatia muelleri]|eukprot:Em0001g833a
MANKTLVHNWVEERQCANLEKSSRRLDGTLDPTLHRQGHKGILSTNFAASMEGLSTVKDSYAPASPVKVQNMGKRQELLTRQIYEMVSAEVHEEFHPPPSPPDYTSTMKKDFHRDFVSTLPPPTKEHNVLTEDPLTFWSDNINSITGVSQVTCSKAPFHRNAAFSTPIEQYVGQTLPHNISH